VVKHRAIPDAASRKCQGGKEPRACTANGACGGPGGDNAADADQPGKQVADGVGIKRQDTLQADRQHIEEASVQIEVLEMEHGLVGKPACIVSDDEFAVLLLHFLIIGDRIIAEGESDQNDKYRKERGRSPMVSAAITSRQRRSKPVR
jgi:hypothetical protein